eukprot:6135148-Heterocapsa_arctica.AAC.2
MARYSCGGLECSKHFTLCTRSWLSNILRADDTAGRIAKANLESMVGADEEHFREQMDMLDARSKFVKK